METGMNMAEMFNLIQTYHEKLGYPGKVFSNQDRNTKVREISLALFMEVAELTDSTPWKPWRAENKQPLDYENLIVEIVDIMFFVASIKEVYEISTVEIERMFHKKLQENYRRLSKGYHGRRIDTTA